MEATPSPAARTVEGWVIIAPDGVLPSLWESESAALAQAAYLEGQYDETHAVRPATLTVHEGPVAPDKEGE